MSKDNEGQKLVSPPRLVVLAVDDESLILSTFERNFRTKFDVRVAKSGAEALDIVKDAQPDLLISDFSMPGMNGLELLEKAAELRPSMVRLLATAHAQSKEVVDAQQNGVFSILVEKPWTRAGMLEAIARALETESEPKA